MANSKWTYVKQFETSDICMPNTWMVLRVDGRQFKKFSKDHEFLKPNDDRALHLMTKVARVVMIEYWPEVRIAYGQSDEYSFVFWKQTKLFNRRSSKILSLVASKFSSSFVYYWSEYFPVTKLLYPPSFDARIVLYPSDENMLDYLRWRQADCHINNLYNIVFWNLVLKQGELPQDAEKILRSTNASDKNEILFSKFGINYNNLPELYRKGTVLYRKDEKSLDKNLSKDDLIAEEQTSIIESKFWTVNNHLLSP